MQEWIHSAANIYSIAAVPFTVTTTFHAGQHFQVTCSYKASQPMWSDMWKYSWCSLMCNFIHSLVTGLLDHLYQNHYIIQVETKPIYLFHTDTHNVPIHSKPPILKPNFDE